MQCLLPDNRCHVDFIQICIKCKSTSDKRGPDSALRSRQQKGNVRAPNKITGSEWSGHRTFKSLAPHLTCTKGFGKILHFITSCSFPAPRFHENHQLERSKARWSQRNWKSWTALRAVSADPKMNAQLWLQKGARLQGVQLHESANTWNFDHRDTLNLFVAAWSHTHKILFFFFRLLRILPVLQAVAGFQVVSWKKLLAHCFFHQVWVSYFQQLLKCLAPVSQRIL